MRRRSQTVIAVPLDLTDEEIAEMSGESVSEGIVQNRGSQDSHPDKRQQKRRRGRNRWHESQPYISNI